MCVCVCVCVCVYIYIYIYIYIHCTIRHGFGYYQDCLDLVRGRFLSHVYQFTSRGPQSQSPFHSLIPCPISSPQSNSSVLVHSPIPSPNPHSHSPVQIHSPIPQSQSTFLLPSPSSQSHIPVCSPSPQSHSSVPVHSLIPQSTIHTPPPSSHLTLRYTQHPLSKQ